MYLYGGYQILSGSLHDFYSISLDESEPTFNWHEIPLKGKHPGSRSKHALVAAKNRIYLIGGLLSNNDASDDIFEFNPDSNEWALIKPEGAKLPPLESFGAVAVQSADEEKIIIAFGFNELLSSPTNTVYEYNITKNKLSVLFEGTKAGSESNISPYQDVPSPRFGCGLTTDNSNVYFFGGKNESTRLNDGWMFSLNDYKYHRLSDAGEVPYIRNGHSINYYEGKLYVFGGIHDVTWELDDLHIYDLKVLPSPLRPTNGPRWNSNRQGRSKRRA